MPSNPPINDVPFRRPYRVRWGDADASGYVHFANYIRMMEETEYAWLRTRGLSVVMHDQRGVLGFPRVNTEIAIENPAQFGDELDIWLRLAESDGVKIEYQFEILREAELVASGQFTVACCRFPRGAPPRAILIPDFFRELFR